MTAAYEAGCRADNNDTEHAGAGAPLGKAVLAGARNALGKLVALSAARKQALSLEALMLGDGEHSVLDGEQIDFLQSFAKELTEYFGTERHTSEGQLHEQRQGIHCQNQRRTSRPR